LQAAAGGFLYFGVNVHGVEKRVSKRVGGVDVGEFPVQCCKNVHLLLDKLFYGVVSKTGFETNQLRRFQVAVCIVQFVGAIF